MYDVRPLSTEQTNRCELLYKSFYMNRRRARITKAVKQQSKGNKENFKNGFAALLDL